MMLVHILRPWYPWLLTLACLCTGPASAQPSEYEVKAAFLSNFARFCEWPAPEDSSATLQVCILGKDPFGSAFDDIIGRPVRQQTFGLSRVDSLAAAEDCQLLFVADSAPGRLDEVLKEVADRPVITVGDGEEFVRRGGMVGFVIRNRKIRFVINPDAAEKVGIRFSSRLLRVAEIYQAQD